MPIGVATINWSSIAKINRAANNTTLITSIKITAKHTNAILYALILFNPEQKKYQSKASKTDAHRRAFWTQKPRAIFLGSIASRSWVKDKPKNIIDTKTMSANDET